VQEIVPGLWHWTALRESIGSAVSSYYLRAERVAIDPMLPPERPDWFAPKHVYLTCRHHDRDAWRLQDELGCDVGVASSGAHELKGRGDFETFEWGDTLPGGVTAVEVDAISPDETAFFLPGYRALAVADGLIRWEPGGPLGFVPDKYMDEPERTKEGLRAAFRRICAELDFDVLLLAHGDPVVGGARDELRAFVES